MGNPSTDADGSVLRTHSSGLMAPLRRLLSGKTRKQNDPRGAASVVAPAPEDVLVPSPSFSAQVPSNQKPAAVPTNYSRAVSTPMVDLSSPVGRRAGLAPIIPGSDPTGNPYPVKARDTAGHVTTGTRSISSSTCWVDIDAAKSGATPLQVGSAPSTPHMTPGRLAAALASAPSPSRSHNLVRRGSDVVGSHASPGGLPSGSDKDPGPLSPIRSGLLGISRWSNKVACSTRSSSSFTAGPRQPQLPALATDANTTEPASPTPNARALASSPRQLEVGGSMPGQLTPTPSPDPAPAQYNRQYSLLSIISPQAYQHNLESSPAAGGSKERQAAASPVLAPSRDWQPVPLAPSSGTASAASQSANRCFDAHLAGGAGSTLRSPVGRSFLRASVAEGTISAGGALTPGPKGPAKGSSCDTYQLQAMLQRSAQQQAPRAATPEGAPAAAAVTAAPQGAQLLCVGTQLPAAMRKRKWALEDYRAVQQLYKGEQSTVFKAVCLVSGMTVALKLYNKQAVGNAIHMVHRELEIQSNLQHVNVLLLYAAFEDDEHIVLVQEYAAYGDMYALHRRLGGRMTEAQVAQLVLPPFLRALEHLHARSICHRDIKPENILFTEDWTLKLADFGVAIDLQEERAVTRAGTEHYMAPEVQACPLKYHKDDNKDDPSLAYGPAADVWSVGVLAYEMLVGFPPFCTPPAQPNQRQPQAQQLRFPSFLTEGAKDFIACALSEWPGDRPTVRQLLAHPWLVAASRGGVSASVSSSRLAAGSPVAGVAVSRGEVL